MADERSEVGLLLASLLVVGYDNSVQYYFSLAMEMSKTLNFLGGEASGQVNLNPFLIYSAFLVTFGVINLHPKSRGDHIS